MMTLWVLKLTMQTETFARLAGAVGKTPGADFDSILAFGGRKRCNLVRLECQCLFW